MFSNIKVFIEIVKLLWETYLWVKGRLDDISYQSKKKSRVKLIKAIGSNDRMAELKALEELGR